MAASVNGDDKSDMEEQEEALVALIEHRTKEVNHLRMRVAYYESELDESRKKLEETQRQLARLRNRSCDPSTRSFGRIVRVKKEISSSPLKICEDSFHNITDESNRSSCDSYEEACLKNFKTKPKGPKPLLVIPGMNPKVSPPVKMTEYNKASSERKSLVKENGYGLLPKQEAVESQARGTKRKFEENEDKDLSEVICSSSSPCMINCGTSNHIPSQHKRKLRSLVLCPKNDQLFATSALDGIVNMWQIQGRGSHANLVSSINCASMKHRRWPEDVAWHPNGNSLISVYSADGGDSQISILNVNNGEVENEVTFLEDKPHVKGVINNVMFMPWDNNCFITGGSDHGVVHWNQKHNDDNKSWKPKLLHRSMHSSAVMGVAGMLQKQTVVSVGADKRIIGFDLHTEKADYKHQIESKCMSVLPNPCDFNLFMVQTGTPQKQLRLFDIRLKHTEIHEFGWKQESSMSQSALISQAWSPDGLYLTSGSADPVIHIFDIRFKANEPSQSIKAHQKRVFKAAWHHSLPLLISISSDLNIGLHHIISYKL